MNKPVKEIVTIIDCTGKGYQGDWCVFVERRGDFINSGWRFFPTRTEAQEFALKYCEETDTERGFSIL